MSLSAGTWARIASMVRARSSPRTETVTFRPVARTASSTVPVTLTSTSPAPPTETSISESESLSAEPLTRADRL